MKKIYLLILSIISITFLDSCGSDDIPAPPHEVGEWDLDSYFFANLPSGFQDNEGAAFNIDQLSFGGVAYDEYVISLKSDGTFVRNIDITGPDVEDEGTWELNDETLILDSEVGGEQEWKVEKNESNDLWLSFETQNSFVPDIYFDTVTDEYRDYLDTLSEDQIDSVLNSLSETVLFDLVFVFDRQ